MLYLVVTGHEPGKGYPIEADLRRRGKRLDVALTASGKLDESPASIEVEIPSEGLASGRYDVAVRFDGKPVGTFRCDIGELAEKT